jgi:hypothetical protein
MVSKSEGLDEDVEHDVNASTMAWAVKGGGAEVAKSTASPGACDHKSLCIYGREGITLLWAARKESTDQIGFARA